MKNFETIQLSVGNNLITDKSRDAFRVESGAVFVYIAELHKNSAGRRTLLYEAHSGEIIPAFFYTDEDNLRLCFCLSSDNALISVMPDFSTKVLRRRFAEKAGIENLDIEGFNEAVAEKYRFMTVSDDGYLKRRNISEENVSDKIVSEITNAFSKEQEPEHKTDNPLYNVVSLICDYSGIELASFYEIKNAGFVNPKLDDITAVSNFTYRAIKLDDNWYNENYGTLLAFDEKGVPIACIPRNNHSYNLYNADGEIKKADNNTVRNLRKRAYVFYRPLPQKKLSQRDVCMFWYKSLKTADVIKFFIISLITTLTALVIPMISRELYDLYIPLGLEKVLLELGALLLGLLVSNILFSIIRQLCLYKQSLIVGYDFQNAVIHRLFTLPQSFFRRYDSAKLAVGVSTAASSSGRITGEILSLVISLTIAVIYLACMIFISPIMSTLGVAALLVYSVFYFVLSRSISRRTRECAVANAQTTAVLTSLIHGVAKLKTSSAEEKAFLQYLKSYIKGRNLQEKVEKTRGNMLTVSLASSGLFSIIFYLVCFSLNFRISVGEFIAFVALFSGLSGYITSVINSFTLIMTEKSELKRLEPVFDEEPEDVRSTHILNRFKYEIKIEHLSFSYREDMVLNDINLTIKKGEYIAFSGISGSGKSTLLKLLLGFEKPAEGRILYDGYDLQELNKKLLRRNIGAVLQDSCLIAGSIFDNITVSRPDASVSEVNAAVKLAALDEDIEKMPMGLHTVLGEENSSISEGQKQKILIARAILSNPDILILDEATGALDNNSQSIVTETLKKSSATKLVAAHRLSTVMECDRIIVIDEGNIVESGSPDELLKRGGLFAHLAERQLGGSEL